VRLRQFVAGHAPVVILLQGLQTDRAEDFFRSCESSEQPLEVVSAVNPPAKLVREHRFRRSGGADDEDVVGRKQSSQRPIDQIRSFEEGLFELVTDLF
jgi:hypothetical protein